MRSLRCSTQRRRPFWPYLLTGVSSSSHGSIGESETVQLVQHLHALPGTAVMGNLPDNTIVINDGAYHVPDQSAASAMRRPLAKRPPLMSGGRSMSNGSTCGMGPLACIALQVKIASCHRTSFGARNCRTAKVWIGEGSACVRRLRIFAL